jgi:hypothetical protein
MAIKIENQATIPLPKRSEQELEKIIKSVPIEHMRGLEKVRLVDYIKDPRLKNINLPMKADLPGLYHPRMGNQAPWLEVSIGALLKPTESYFNRIMPRMAFKANLAGLIFSLIGQHYYLTLRHSVKKTQLESQVRQYAEKQLKMWSEKQAEGTWRAAIFKPFRPLLERLAKWLNSKALAAQKSGK